MHEGRIVRRFARGEASAEMIVSAAIANDDAEPPHAAPEPARAGGRS
jgi:hypothetical protein